MEMTKVNLQFFATLDDVVTENADAFGEGDTTKDNFEALSEKLKGLGYDVLKLKREKYAFLTLEGLKSGEYRNLTPKEVKILYSLAHKKKES